jgi:hypothetical protein
MTFKQKTRAKNIDEIDKRTTNKGLVHVEYTRFETSLYKLVLIV